MNRQVKSVLIGIYMLEYDSVGSAKQGGCALMGGQL